MKFCVHNHAQTKRSTALKFCAEVEQKVFERFLKWFYWIIFWRYFSRIFVLTILLFHINFWTKAPIFFFIIDRKKFPFYLNTIVNYLAVQQFRVCLPVCLNICLVYKLCKNLSILMKFGYIFAVSNLSLYTKNCDCKRDSLYRATSKFWFVSIYVPLSIITCDKNVTRTGLITDF